MPGGLQHHVSPVLWAARFYAEHFANLSRK